MTIVRLPVLSELCEFYLRQYGIAHRHIRAAGRQAAACRDKYPMIGIANDTDEEIIHVNDVGNTIKRFAITGINAPQQEEALSGWHQIAFR